jgi:hypothetical protein
MNADGEPELYECFGEAIVFQEHAVVQDVPSLLH